MADPCPTCGTPPVPPVTVGTTLHGFCGGVFGRDSYSCKQVEAVGADWVVARDDVDGAWFAGVAPAALAEYVTDRTYCGCWEGTDRG